MKLFLFSAIASLKCRKPNKTKEEDEDAHSLRNLDYVCLDECRLRSKSSHNYHKHRRSKWNEEEKKLSKSNIKLSALGDYEVSWNCIIHSELRSSLDSDCCEIRASVQHS